MLPLNLYYADINLSCYYTAVMLLFKVNYAIIMLILHCYSNNSNIYVDIIIIAA